LDAALTLAGDSGDLAIAEQVLPGRTAPAPADGSDVQFPEPAAHSEWGQVAVLRRNWMRDSEHLVIAYDDRRFRAELNCGATTVWSGLWATRITIDGRPVDVQGDWEEVCWYTDDDVDYLELEIPYSGGWRLQRQVLLARDDRFLFTADALLGAREAEIEYRNALPLCAGVRFAPERQTREGWLIGRRRMGLVLPIALPEWRAQESAGFLDAAGDGLRLMQRRRARRMYAPLFIDLDPKRAARQRTWRQLTVAQRLEVQPSSVAVGYRVQVGDHQWLFYRSLAASASRTVLGQNLSSEFFAGRFRRDGHTEQLIEVSVAE